MSVGILFGLLMLLCSLGLGVLWWHLFHRHGNVRGGLQQTSVDLAALEKEEERLQKDRLRLERELHEAEVKRQLALGLVADAEVERDRIAGLTAAQAREEILQEAQRQSAEEAAKVGFEIAEKARREAEKKAKHIIAAAIGRLAREYVNEGTVTVVRLPSDEFKGRIIGREGRNIRAFEAHTGVNVLIDDTPEIVVLSSFCPRRRRHAQMTLERLIDDGRIHPGRVEEVAIRCEGDLADELDNAAQEAMAEVAVYGIDDQLVTHLGELSLHSFAGQNGLVHSIETALIAGALAAELGLPVDIARRAGLLHDIGRTVKGRQSTLEHGEAGGAVAARCGESDEVVGAIADHHKSKASTPLDVVVQAADIISRHRPGARNKAVASYVARIENMERLCKSFSGVESAVALQAGTEVRVVVNCNEVEEQQLGQMAWQIASSLEKSQVYPGEIKVLVTRREEAVAPVSGTLRRER